MKHLYDVIVIGAGATGSGIALDATLRGYKTLLIDKGDFGSQTSSNSTKLVHGGVRYLEKAFLHFNYSQLKLVTEALQERYYFLHNTMNISQNIKLSISTNSLFESIYYTIGLKLYDLFSFSKSLGSSQGNINKISFYDGSFNDARMIIALIQSAQTYGCKVKNYQEMTQFIYKNALLQGIQVKTQKGKTKEYFSKCIINATGNACDKLRIKDDKKAEELLIFSRGSHLVLDSCFTPKEGKLFFNNDDGRVIFILPWQNACLVGTTEESTKYNDNPIISQKEKEYLLHYASKFLNQVITSKDIKSTFSGIRPLIKSKSNNLSNTVREHAIVQSPSNLISITGGKWTTYRKMAQECLDFCIEKELLEPKRACITKSFKLIGNNIKIVPNNLKKWVNDEAVLKHLINIYGDQCYKLLKHVEDTSLYTRIVPQFPFIKAEILYCIHHEYIKTPMDYLMRRISIGKTNLQASKMLLKPVTKIMAQELQWSITKIKHEYKLALKELNELLHSI